MDNSPAKLQLAAWNDLAPGGPASLTSKPGYAISTNSGGTWTVSVVPPSNGYGFDPSVGFDREGRGFYCYVASDAGFGTDTLMVARTTNYGINWSRTVVANIAFEDKPYMAIDNTGGARDGRIYVSWTEFASGTAIKFSYSSDHGVTFSTPITLSTGFAATDQERTVPTIPEKKGEGSSGGYVQGSFPAVAPNGDLYVLWARPNGATTNIELKKSTDGGVSFGSTTTVATAATAFHAIGGSIGYHDIRTDASTMMATNPATGDIYISFTQVVSGNLKGYFTRSTNNGASWSTPILCTGNLSGWQYWPWIAVYPSGKISIAFRHSSDQQNVTTWVTESIDRGVSFQTPFQVTDSASNLSSLLGRCHYFGNTAVTGFSFPLWDDTRGHTPQNNRQADVFWACLNRQSTSSSPAATASGGSGRKTVYSASTSTWHTVFQSNNQITYAYSNSEGVYWADNSTISGTMTANANSSPSIALYQNNPHVVFASASGVYYNRKVSGAWLAQPVALTYLNRETPSLAIDNSGYGHIVYVYRPAGGAPGTPNLTYGKFNTADAQPSLTDVISLDAAQDLASSPSITLDVNQIPHVVWSRGGEIYYSNRIGGSWSTAVNLSNNSGTSINPTSSSNGTTIYVAWQDNTTGNDEIYYRVRTSGTWGSVQNISNNSGASTYPAINGPFAGVPVIVWSDNTGGNWDIKYRWMGDVTVNTFSATAGVSSYPSFSFKQTGADAYRLYAIWTEGSGAPFEIPPVTKDISTLPQGGDDGEQRPVVQNYPNPFNPSTQFTFELFQPGSVSLVIYDILGRQVAELARGNHEPGRYSVVWNAADGSDRHVSSGVYFARFTLSDELGGAIHSRTTKLLLMK